MKYYLAYASNLNKEEMENRCSSAKALGTAVLEDYQLAFCRHATIVKEPGAYVPVGVWQIDEECEKMLDRYEGYPHYYTKETVSIEFEGKEIEALIYMMNKEHANFRLPHSDYLDDVTRGYIDFNFKVFDLFSALQYTKNAIENKKVFYWFSPEKSE